MGLRINDTTGGWLSYLDNQVETLDNRTHYSNLCGDIVNISQNGGVEYYSQGTLPSDSASSFYPNDLTAGMKKYTPIFVNLASTYTNAPVRPCVASISTADNYIHVTLETLTHTIKIATQNLTTTGKYLIEEVIDKTNTGE